MSKVKFSHIKSMVDELFDRCETEGLTETDIPRVTEEIIRKKRQEIIPGIAGFSKEGQTMIDAQGNKALVFPDGSIKEIV